MALAVLITHDGLQDRLSAFVLSALSLQGTMALWLELTKNDRTPAREGTPVWGWGVGRVHLSLCALPLSTA